MGESADADSKWPARLTAAVAANVRRLRERHVPPLSALALSERTHALGHRVHRTLIADMEAGRRASIGLADVLVLARALEAPPLELIAPLDGAPTEILPGEAESNWDAIDWIAGMRPVPGVADDGWEATAEGKNWQRNADLQLRKFAAAVAAARVYEIEDDYVFGDDDDRERWAPLFAENVAMRLEDLQAIVVATKDAVRIAGGDPDDVSSIGHIGTLPETRRKSAAPPPGKIDG